MDSQVAERTSRAVVALATAMPDMVPAVRTSVLPDTVENLEAAAKIIQFSPATNKDVAGNNGACMALAFLSADWNMSPIMLGSKAYLASGRLSFEAQVIIALGLARTSFARKLEVTFHGEGKQRHCHVRGKMRGHTQWQEYTSPTFEQVRIKNSPLWFADPDQQFAYYSQMRWFRRHNPAAILGLYAPDEMEREVVDPGPDPYAVDLPANPVPSGGGLIIAQPSKDDAPAKGGKGKVQQKPREDLEPDDMPQLREWLAGVQKAALDEKDPDKAVALWDEARKHKNMGRIKAYAPDLNRTAYAAVCAHVEKLRPAKNGDPGKDTDTGFPGDR